MGAVHGVQLGLGAFDRQAQVAPGLTIHLSPTGDTGWLMTGRTQGCPSLWAQAVSLSLMANRGN